MSTPVRIKKNVRSTNRQLEALVDYMSTHLEFANNQLGGHGRRGQAGEWACLKFHLAKLGPDKTVEQWRMTWRDLKRKARLEARSKKAHLEAAQARRAQAEAAEARRAQAEAAQARRAQVDAAQARRAQVDAAQARRAQVDAARSRRLLVESVQARKAIADAVHEGRSLADAVRTIKAEADDAQERKTPELSETSARILSIMGLDESQYNIVIEETEVEQDQGHYPSPHTAETFQQSDEDTESILQAKAYAARARRTQEDAARARTAFAATENTTEIPELSETSARILSIIGDESACDVVIEETEVEHDQRFLKDCPSPQTPETSQQSDEDSKSVLRHQLRGSPPHSSTPHSPSPQSPTPQTTEIFLQPEIDTKSILQEIAHNLRQQRSHGDVLNRRSHLNRLHGYRRETYSFMGPRL